MPYFPDSGDIIEMDPSPWADVGKPHGPVGDEMQGKHYGVVVSPQKINNAAGLALICPVTSPEKADSQGQTSLFQIELPKAQRPKKGKRTGARSIEGYVIISQVIACDWIERKAKKKGKVPPAVLEEAKRILARMVDAPTSSSYRPTGWPDFLCR